MHRLLPGKNPANLESSCSQDFLYLIFVKIVPVFISLSHGKKMTCADISAAYLVSVRRYQV